MSCFAPFVSIGFACLLWASAVGADEAPPHKTEDHAGKLAMVRAASTFNMPQDDPRLVHLPEQPARIPRS